MIHERLYYDRAFAAAVFVARISSLTLLRTMSLSNCEAWSAERAYGVWLMALAMRSCE